MGSGSRSWIMQCTALFFPYCAALHHMLFYRQMCLLKPFGDEYDLAALKQLLLRDPAPGWAVVAVLVTHALGQHASLGRLVKLAALPCFFAFLPVTLWVWDIPFAGRPICRHFHDGRLVWPVLGAVRGYHLYAFGLVVGTLATAVRLALSRLRPSDTHVPLTG